MRLLQNSSAFGNLLMALRCGGETETVVKSTIFLVLSWLNQPIERCLDPSVSRVVPRVVSREVPIEGPILESLTIIPGDVKDFARWPLRDPRVDLETVETFRGQVDLLWIALRQSGKLTEKLNGYVRHGSTSFLKSCFYPRAIEGVGSVRTQDIATSCNREVRHVCTMGKIRLWFLESCSMILFPVHFGNEEDPQFEDQMSQSREFPVLQVTNIIN